MSYPDADNRILTGSRHLQFGVKMTFFVLTVCSWSRKGGIMVGWCCKADLSYLARCRGPWTRPILRSAVGMELFRYVIILIAMPIRYLKGVKIEVNMLRTYPLAGHSCLFACVGACRVAGRCWAGWLIPGKFYLGACWSNLASGSPPSLRQRPISQPGFYYCCLTRSKLD